MNARNTTVPGHALRRGTRGFAAFVTGLAGLVVLAVGAVVLPESSLDRLALSWLVPLAIAFGLAHFVAAYGLVRRRAWSRPLVGYLASIGVGVAGYGLLITVTGLDLFGATSRAPSSQASGQGLGLLLWMIGLWAVAARYAFKGIVPVGSGATAHFAGAAA